MTTDPTAFKYDVALSLLHQDVGTAKSIAALLESRFNVFFYDERDLELAGTDGVDQFTSVFRRDARVVVALLRETWGQTTGTRIEKIAIKNRGAAEGYEFLLIIPLDGPACVPDWIPTMHIWGHLERLGVQGVAAVIERMVAEHGKAVRPETAEDVEARLAKQRQDEHERDSFLGSTDGVRAAEAEFASLKDFVEQHRDVLQLRVGNESRGVRVTKEGRSMTITWLRVYGNTLDKSRLRVQLWDGPVGHFIDSNFHARRATSELRLQFDRYWGEVGWRETRGQRRFFTSDELAEHALKVLMNAAYGRDERL